MQWHSIMGLVVCGEIIKVEALFVMTTYAWFGFELDVGVEVADVGKRPVPKCQKHKSLQMIHPQ